MKIGLAGNPNACEVVAGLLLANGVDSIILGTGTEKRLTRILKLRRVVGCDIVHCIGYGHPEILFAGLLRKPVIRHWIGSDVLRILFLPHTLPWSVRMRWRLTKRFITKHLAITEQLSQELKQAGITAAEVPIAPAGLERVGIARMPDEFTVLSYWHDTSHDFYKSTTILRLAQHFPNIKFLIMRAEGMNLTAPSNVEFLGWVQNMKALWDKISVCVRLTEHDGLSHLVLEALARGKHVIWNNAFPFVRYGSGFEEVVKILQELAEKPEQLNRSGADWVKNEFHTMKVSQQILSVYKEILENQCADKK